ncbi:hypothetical protein Taro_013981 [Colocasia esculenta]|uniref:Uncharacterized protein n=1 Tax=Colocasia esculenta TaxID=4460 RepID=A0A843UHQ1_COLES|nr:hypothetical protein [Colocasia esculenta]
MNFNFLVLLPNEKPTKIILDEENQNNYISQAIVDILVQTCEIIDDGDQAFVEFHLKFLGRTQKKSVNYFDGAWCTIDPSRSYITLGKEWLEERHVAIDSNQCIIQPPHLRGKFCFPKYISLAAKPVLPEKTVLVEVWDQDLFVESGLHLIYDDSMRLCSPLREGAASVKDRARSPAAKASSSHLLPPLRLDDNLRHVMDNLLTDIGINQRAAESAIPSGRYRCRRSESNKNGEPARRKIRSLPSRGCKTPKSGEEVALEALVLQAVQVSGI